MDFIIEKPDHIVAQEIASRDNAEPNVRIVERGEHPIAVDHQARIEHDGKTEARALAVLPRDDEAVVAAKQPLEQREVLAPFGSEARKLLQLLSADRAAHLEGAHVVARQNEAIGLEMVAAAPLKQRRMRRQVARPAVRANAFAQMSSLLVVGEDHAAFHRRYVVREEE